MRHNEAMTLRRLLPLIAIVSLVAVGCRPSGIVIGGVPRTEENTVKTIISLSPSTTELLGAAGAGQLLIARTAADNYPPGVEQAPIAMTGIKPDFEMIASMNPDLLLYDTSLFSESDIQKIEESGIESMGLDLTSLASLEDSLAMLGEKIGYESAFSKYMDDVRRAVLATQSELDGRDISVSVVIGGDGRYMAAGKKTFISDLLTTMGADVKGTDAALYTDVNVESLLEWNPDVVFLPVDAAEGFLADVRLKNLKAVQNQKVFGVDPDILLRTGARIPPLVKAMESPLTQAATGN